MKTLFPSVRIGSLVFLFFVSLLFNGFAHGQVVQTNVAVTVRHAPNLNGNGIIEGSVQQLLGETVTLNGGFVLTGDLLVPGTPKLVLNGRPAFGGAVPGSGPASPAGYNIILNGSCSMHYLRTRTAPISLPNVTSPPQPAGTRNLTLTTPGQSIGNPATLRNLTANGNLGQIAVPPGTYGSFIANGGSGFTLGVAGATSPVVYNLQNLTLNGGSQLRIVSPVIVTVANGFTGNGLMGATNQSSWFQLQIARGGFTLNGGCTVHGNVTAPAGTIILNGNSRLFGVAQCDRLIVNGGSIRWSGAGTVANQAPTALSQSLNIPEDNALAVTLLGNDPEGAGLTYTILSQPGHGTLAGAAPQLVYTPDPDFNGTDSFAFKVNDGQADSGTATISLTVNPINDAPAAQAQSVSTAEDMGLNVTLGGNDPDNDPLTFQVVTSPSHGILTGFAPNLIYTPSTDFVGQDSFTYAVSDGQASSPTEVVSITVIPVDDAPVAANQTVAVDEDMAANIALTAVDVEGDGLLFTVLTLPAHGTLSGTPPILVYRPATNFNGNDRFTFQASDAWLDSAPATIDLVVRSVNDLPAAIAQTVVVPEDVATNLVLEGTDVDGDPLSFSLMSSPANGTLNGVAPDVIFSPAADFNGTNTFTFVVADAGSTSAPAVVTLIVTPVNDRPIADARIVTLIEDTPVSIVLGGTDVDGDTLGWVVIAPPTNGTLSGIPPNVIYMPGTNFSGVDAFAYEVSDGTTNSAAATVTLIIQPINDAPLADHQVLAAEEDTSIAVVLTGDDAEDEALTFAVVTPPAHGTLTGTPPHLIYTPATNYHGADSFTFVSNDGQLDSSPATISVAIAPVNDAPVAQNLTIHVGTQSVKGTLTATDIDGDTLFFVLQEQGKKGAAAVNTNGEFVYTPQSGAAGADTFGFKVTDGHTSAGGVVTVMVSSINRPPVASSKTVTTAEDTPLTLTLHGSDPDDDPLTFEIIEGPANGSLDILDFTYRPAPDFSGADSFRFIARDGATNSAPAAVFITVTPVNDPPELHVPASPLSLVRGKSISFNNALSLSISDVDHDGGPVKLSAFATNGTLRFHVADGIDLGLTWISEENNPTNPIVMGSFDSIQSLLNGWGHLAYTASADFPNGDLITLTIDDLGHTGEGGSRTDITSIQLIAANVPPTVAITEPASPSEFAIGEQIPIKVFAGDVDGALGSVKLHANGVLLAEWVSPPYDFALTNAGLGEHVLFATAIDNKGALTASSTVTVSVVEAGSGNFTVHAGGDQVIEISHPALLNGTAGIPPPASESEANALWSMISGPGTVQFSNPESLSTSASFSEPGSYLLILRVSYNGGTRSDTILVTVLDLPSQRLSAARSTKGTDFWLTYLFQPAFSDHGIFNRVAIAADIETEVRLENGGFAFSDAWSVETNYIRIAAGTVAIIPVRSPTSFGIDPVNETIASNYVHISASAPVTVHGLTRTSSSADGFLALPTAMLSTNYMVMSYPGGSDFAVLATEGDTRVTIIPTANISGRPAAQPWTFILQRGQSYRVATFDGDYTGTRITSDKPIVVMGGAVGATVPEAYCCADHLCEQMTPISMWGRHFVSLPLAARSGGDTFRFLAAEDYTCISVNGAVVATLNRGQFHEQLIEHPAVILSSKPILIAQFANGQNFDQHTGDPFLTLVPPVEQFGGHYLMNALTLAGSRFAWEEAGWTVFGEFDPSVPGLEYSSHLNLIVYGNGTNSVSIDGMPLPGSAFQPIANSGYFGAQLPLSNAAHLVTGPVPIGGLVYGWAEFESYAFAAGLYTESIEPDIELLLTQRTLFSAVGNPKRIAGRVTNGRGLPVADIDLPFEVTGANPTNGRARTSRFGEALFTYTGANPGVDVITVKLPGLEKSVTNTWMATENLPPLVTVEDTAPVQAGLVLRLKGVVSDDALPIGSALNIRWRLLDGPGGAVFENATLAETLVTCSEPGTYRFELAADDSQFSSHETVKVTAGLAPSLQFPAQEIPAIAQLGGTVQISARAGDADGPIQRIEFHAGGVLIGAVTNYAGFLSESDFFDATISWTPPASGVWELRATAYDLFGISTASDPFSLRVSSSPLVAIDNLVNGAVITVPTNVVVHAAAFDLDGAITSLAILLNGQTLAESTNGELSAFWNPRSQGDYTLSAIAVDDLGLTTASESVTVSVTGAFPQVVITNPVAPGSTFVTPTGKPIRIAAHASIAAPYSITNVLFEIWNEPFTNVYQPPYEVEFAPPAGVFYRFVAEAYADSGAIGVSAPLLIQSVPDASIAFLEPLEGQSLIVGNPTPLRLSLRDPWNILRENTFGFFANGQHVGQSTNHEDIFWAPPAPGGYTLFVEGSPFPFRAGIGVTASLAIPSESVVISQPEDGASVHAGVPVPVSVTFHDPLGAYDRVEFFANGDSIGQTTNTTLLWTPSTTNDYRLTATLRDRYGQSYPSQNTVLVHALRAPPIENVAIVYPENGETNHVGVVTPIVLTFDDPAGTFDHAEFFANNVSLGQAIEGLFAWMPSMTGDYVLTATVYDGIGNAYPGSNSVLVHVAPLPRPELSILSPVDGSRIQTNAETAVIASLDDPASIATNVLFYVNGLLASEGSTYFTWTPTALGSHALYCVAFTSDGDTIVSPTVTVMVAELHSPMVTLLSPTNDQQFAFGAQPLLRAQASDSDGSISNLVLRLDFNIAAETNAGSLEVIAADLAAGWHEAVAQATDSDGLVVSVSTRFFIERAENPPLPVPGHLAASGVSATEIELSWQAVATNELTQAILIERWDFSQSLWREARQLPATDTNYLDADLPPETMFRYRIACLDTNGNRSSFSMEVDATTRTVVPTYAVIDLSAEISGALTNLARGGNILFHADLNHFDVRRTVGLGSRHAELVLGTNGPGLSQAVARFNERWPEIQLDFDPVLLSPHSILPRVGYLTGPGGLGGTVSPETANLFDPADSVRPLKAFLHEHQSLFGFGPEAISNAIVQRDYVSPGTGARTIVWQQQVGGIPVFNARFIGHITAAGELAAVSSGFVPPSTLAVDSNLLAAVLAGEEFQVTNPQALLTAATNVGDIFDLADLTGQSEAQGVMRSQTFSAGRGIKGDAHVELTWFPVSRSELKLARQVILTSQWRNEMYLTIVSALDQEILYRRNLTADSAEATYRVYAGSSPAPMSPGLPAPGGGQAASVDRSLLTFAALDAIASPDGWIPDGVNETRGNNVDAHLDRNDDDRPDLPRPVGNPSRVFDFPLDLNGDPAGYGSAAAVQLFYWNNWMHDALYVLGFTEAAGNFQNDNFGRGGVGGDAVQADAQDGAGLSDGNHHDNASMSTPPDGYPPRMRMYTFTGAEPDRDGSLDAEIILHEYTHGLTARLIGGGAGIDALQTAGMGEGWSDFFALALLTDPGANPDEAYPIGAYVTYHGFGSQFEENYYYGIRRYPCCTDTNRNPLTFADIDPAKARPHSNAPRNPLFGPFDSAKAGEVHNQGEVWCMMLWEMRANLIRQHGGASGNNLALRLVTEGLRLCPPNPNFVQARDAILLADRMLTGGANTTEIWAAFTKRGLGYSAKAPYSYTTTGTQESFAPAPTLVVERIEVQGGNGNRTIEANEGNSFVIVVRNQGTTAATEVLAHISTTTPGVEILAAQSVYDDIPEGQSRGNSVPLRIRTLPEFVEGTRIDLIVTLSSAQRTVTNTLPFHTGSSGPSLPAGGDPSFNKRTSGSSAMRDLTPWDLGNLEPLWMAEDASCLLKAGEYKYVLWRPDGNLRTIANPEFKFLAHRLTRHGAVVGTVIESDTTDEAGNIMRHSSGAWWDFNANMPVPLTRVADGYRWPKNEGPLSSVGAVHSAVFTNEFGFPLFLTNVTTFPTLHDAWDMNASGRAVGSLSMQANFALQQVFFDAKGEMTWFTATERGLSAGQGGHAAMQVNYRAQLTTAAQFNGLEDWRWLGPLNWVTPTAYATLINDAGMVAGVGTVHFGEPVLDSLVPTHAFRAPLTGEAAPFTTLLTGLDTLPGGLHSFPRAMNQSGDLVGYSDFDGGNNAHKQHAVLWTMTNNTPEDLGSLGFVPDAPQGYSDAYGINDLRQIVGTSWRISDDGSSTVPTGVLWHLNRNTNGSTFWQISDLNPRLTDRRWRILEAVAIENDGIILAGGSKLGMPDKRVVMLIPAALRVDFNRDGRIDELDATRGVYRFWINDDNDYDAAGPTDIPGQSPSHDLEDLLPTRGVDWQTIGGTGSVDGIRDLIDFFPVFLDVRGLMALFPPGPDVKYKLKHAEEALNFVYSGLTPGKAAAYQMQERGPIYGNDLQDFAGEAETLHITEEGVELSAHFLNRIKSHGQGVILVEGRKRTITPLVLSVEKSNGQVLAQVDLVLWLSDVEDMFCHKNLMAAGGSSGGKPDRFNPPNELPHNGRNFVFCHGYNVNPDQARGWQSEIFKRLFWAGSKARFWGVTWYGADSQLPFMRVTVDYQRNVVHAFDSSNALKLFLKNEIGGGSVTIAGHSLGNMLISSAIHDWDAKPSIYVAIDAAVATEAYDGEREDDPNGDGILEMSNPFWQVGGVYYNRRYWASDWYKLWPSHDWRSRLTWKNRFEKVKNVINFFSSGEEVLANPRSHRDVRFPTGTGHVWDAQERMKGRLPLGLILTSNSGGWGFSHKNDFYRHDATAMMDLRLTPQEMDSLHENEGRFSDEFLRSHPFFKPGPSELYDPVAGDSYASPLRERNRILAEMIPALSFALGSNPGKRFDNVDMNKQTKQNGWPRFRPNAAWRHSDIRDVPYFYTQHIFHSLVEKGNLK